MRYGIVRKSALLGAQEGLEGHFANVFDIDIVLGYKMAEFFDFCRYLTFYGYKADGFEGKLSAPEELVRNHVGNCWDQTELQREWFEKHGHEVKIYLLYYYVRDDLCPSHSILAFRGKSSDFGGEDGTKKGLKQGFRDGFKEGKWYWFEPMFGRSQGDSGDGLGVEYAFSCGPLIKMTVIRGTVWGWNMRGFMNMIVSGSCWRISGEFLG